MQSELATVDGQMNATQPIASGHINMDTFLINENFDNSRNSVENDYNENQIDFHFLKQSV